MRNAKELCAMLITRSLKDLNEDEEEIVVDYLEDLGIETDLDTKPKDLCYTLLTKIKDERVPLTAYANSILSKEKEKVIEKKKEIQEKDLVRKRFGEQKKLETTKLPGCVPSEDNIFSKNLYTLKSDPRVGIVNLNDGTAQYSSLISLSSDLYTKIFLDYSNPVIEITNSKGNKAYTRVGEPHDGSSELILVSPLISTLLNFKNVDGGFVRLCIHLPEISKVDFTFYGNKMELDEILPSLITKLPSVINAFSYLSLGMVLKTKINGREIEVRVDKLEDTDLRPIFAGLIPFSEGDLPFEITPDI